MVNFFICWTSEQLLVTTCIPLVKRWSLVRRTERLFCDITICSICYFVLNEVVIAIASWAMANSHSQASIMHFISLHTGLSLIWAVFS